MLQSLAPALEKLKLPPKGRGSYQANPELTIFNFLGGKLKISGSTFKARGTFFACISFIFLPMFGIYTPPEY